MNKAAVYRALLSGLFAGVAAAAADASPTTIPVGPDLEGLGWRHLEFSGKSPNRFVGHDDGSIEVTSSNSVSGLYYRLPENLIGLRCLAWSWRVDEAMPANDLTWRGFDDRPISVYVGYRFDADRASFWENFVRVFVEMRHGSDAPGRAIAYTWGGLGTRGEVQSSPYMRSAGAIVLLRPGDTSNGRWVEDAVDFRADYERVFGDTATAPTQIALLADSDDTGIPSRAYVRDLRFEETCPERPEP